MMRTLTEILKEADNATTLDQLTNLMQEILKGSFSESEMEIAKEVFNTIDFKIRTVHKGFSHINFDNSAMISNQEKIINPEMLRKSTEKLMDSGIKGAFAGTSLRDLLLKFPKKPTFWQRVKQAWKVLRGK